MNQEELRKMRESFKDFAATWQDRRCRHNYDIEECPWPHCAARLLYEALERLLDAPCNDQAYGAEVSELAEPAAVKNARAALAKARGEQPE